MRKEGLQNLTLPGNTEDKRSGGTQLVTHLTISCKLRQSKMVKNQQLLRAREHSGGGALSPTF